MNGNISRKSLQCGRRLGNGGAACGVLGLSRSSYYPERLSKLEGRRIRKEVVELSAQHPANDIGV